VPPPPGLHWEETRHCGGTIGAPLPSVVRLLGPCLTIVEEVDVDLIMVEANIVTASWRRPTQSSWWWKPTPSSHRGGGRRVARSG
jgi:hypothetical protein